MGKKLPLPNGTDNIRVPGKIVSFLSLVCKYAVVLFCLITKKKLLKIDLCKNIHGALSASGESLNSCRLQSHRATCQWRWSQSRFFAEQACWWSQALSCTVAVPYSSKLTALGKGHIVVSITGYYLENLISCPAVGLLSSLL